ncbi:MAG: NAD(P)-dependent oxidoreductase [Propionibacteriaceae bacterium]
MSGRPLVILRPAPQTVERIFSPTALAALHDAFRVEVLPECDDVEERFDALLPEAFAIIGQPDLPASRLALAPRLRALLNVEGNFFPNVDYPAAFERGVQVLGCGPAYATAVAEYALGLALDLARGISREDRAFRAGREGYVTASTADSILLSGARVGLIGFGNLGRALHRLLNPFRCRLAIFDPWLPPSVIIDHDAEPTGLDELLTTSEFVFVLATVTPQSEHLLGAAELDRIRPGARLIMVSRAAVVDYDALLSKITDGAFLAAVDVWPSEPLPADHPARFLEGLVLSAHRAGGIPAAFNAIGDLVVDDLRQIARGLPPVRMQVAAPELVGRYRNRPVS